MALDSRTFAREPRVVYQKPGSPFSWAVPLFAQSNSGELRLKVTDQAGLGVKSSVQLVSEANQVRKALLTDDAGNLVAKLLPFGVYRLEVQHEGFAAFSGSIEIRSAIPTAVHITLRIAPLSTSVTVNDRVHID